MLPYAVQQPAVGVMAEREIYYTGRGHEICYLEVSQEKLVLLVVLVRDQDGSDSTDPSLVSIVDRQFDIPVRVFDRHGTAVGASEAVVSPKRPEEARTRTNVFKQVDQDAVALIGAH